MDSKSKPIHFQLFLGACSLVWIILAATLQAHHHPLAPAAWIGGMAFSVGSLWIDHIAGGAR